MSSKINYSIDQINEAIGKVLAGGGGLDAYIGFGTAPPTEGTWTKPYFLFNINSESGGILGWSLIEAGTPGVWHAAAIISDEPYVP